MVSVEELHRMRDIDIRELDAKNLVDLRKVRIKRDLPIPERVMDYIEQVRNPYCFTVDNIVVKLKFKEDGVSCQEAFYGMANAIR